MAFVPTPNCVTSFIKGTLHSEDVAMTLSWDFGSPAGVQELEVLNGNIEDWLTTHLMPNLASALVFNNVTSYAQDSIEAPLHSHTMNVPGVEVGASHPGNVAMTVTFGTAFRGRSGRGRNFIPGIQEVDSTGNIFDAALRTAIQAAYDILQQDVGVPSGCQHVVISRQVDGVTRTEGRPAPVLTYTVRAQVRTRKSRL